jgi:hypothetical protein
MVPVSVGIFGLQMHKQEVVNIVIQRMQDHEKNNVIRKEKRGKFK